MTENRLSMSTIRNTIPPFGRTRRSTESVPSLNVETTCAYARPLPLTRYALLVENRCQVVGVNISQCEADGSTPPRHRRRTLHSHEGVLSEFLQRIPGELGVVRRHPVHTDLLQILDCGIEADGLDDGRGARLESVRNPRPGRMVELDVGDHLTASFEGLHLLQPLGLSP